MPTNEVIEMIQNGSTKNVSIKHEIDEYPQNLAKAARSSEVPEWVRKAANRIISLAERQNVSVEDISLEEIGLGLHENIVERAVCGTEEERFYKIVMNFENAIKAMRGF